MVLLEDFLIPYGTVVREAVLHDGRFQGGPEPTLARPVSPGDDEPSVASGVALFVAAQMCRTIEDDEVLDALVLYAQLYEPCAVSATLA